MDDLVERDGLFYKKFTDAPFTGEIDEGLKRGSFKNGEQEGPWVSYHDNGQLWQKGDYKNGKEEGTWVWYHVNGQLRAKGALKNGEKEGPWVFYSGDGIVYNEPTGTYKNGKKISD